MKTTLRATLIAAAVAALPLSVSAAGLGRLNVYSALGQPLRAEVEVTGSGEELDSLSARIASPEAFRRANVEYSSVVGAVRVSVEKRNGSALVKLTSDRPIGEPFVDVLLELNWTGGRLVREYTFLLDPASDAPPVTTVDAGPAIVHSAELKPLPQKIPRDRRGRRAPVESGASKPATTPSTGKVSAEGGSEYTVAKGDTLSKIAGDLKPADASLDQMLAALYSANQDSFPGGNINRLRSGQILRVPQAEQVKTLSGDDVRRILSSTPGGFASYRRKLADAAAAAPARESIARQSSSGKIKPDVKEPARSQESGDKLKISKTQTDKDTGKNDKSGARIHALEEDLTARNKALQEASERVAALEKQNKDLQKLIELKTRALAEAQAKAQVPVKPVVEPPKAEPKKIEPPKPVVASAPAPVASTPVKVAAKPPVASAPAPVASAPAVVASAPALVASKPVEVLASAPVAPVASKPIDASAPMASEIKPKLKSAPPPMITPEEPGLMDTLLDNAVPIGGGVGVLALLGVFAFMRNRRRERGPDTTSINATQTSNESVIGPAGGQTVDTGSSVLPTDFSQSGLTSIDADEGVDPVAEADVYMAYGRDAQAEEILLDALKADPGRTAIHVKLLEIYSQRKSLKPFENIATDLYTQTGGVGNDWAKAADLGAKLDPENPLYRALTKAAAQPQQPEPTMLEDISFVEPDFAEPDFEEEPAPVMVPEPVAALPAEPEGLMFEAPELEPPAKPAAPAPLPFGTHTGSEMQATWTMPGEIGQAAAPEPAVTTAMPEDLGLDFNLDIDMTPSLAPVPEPVAPTFIPEVEAPPMVNATIPEPILTEDDMPTLILPKGQMDAEMENRTNIGVRTEPQALTFELDGLGGQTPVIGEDDLGVARAADAKTESLVDLEKTNFEGSLLDFDFNLERPNYEQAAPAPAPRTVDLSGIDLELPPTHAPEPTHAAPVSQSEAALMATHPDGLMLDEEVNVNEEVATKLELARAYEEMRDYEGARELLEEVLQDGSAGQKQEAQTILARLG